MGILIRPRDAGQVGKVRAQPRETFQFAPIAEIPAVSRAVQHHKPTLRLVHQHGAQHGNIRRQPGAGGDENDGFSRRDAVKCEHAARFGSQKNPAAVLQRKQPRRELATGDQRQIKFHIPTLDA